MKKVCFVNCSASGSTGSLVMKLSTYVSSEYSSCFVLGEAPNNANGECLLSSYTKNKYIYHRVGTYLFGNDGFIGGAINKRIRMFLESEKPDLIHIHNIHRSFSNLLAFLEYAKAKNRPIIWTLHDEWALTGRCCSFQQCTKWKTGCGACCRKDLYPKSLLDFSSKYWIYKHKLINQYINLIIFVSPSNWLSDLMLCEYPKAKLIIIRNGVDQTIFKPVGKDERLISIANGRRIIGCVANNLSVDKGFDDIISLSRIVNKDKAVIFVIGGNGKRAIEKINNRLYVLQKVSSKKEMASFYSTIDVLFDPTKGDNYPTTHIECLSCGTPIVTYNVGGSAEAITSKDEGLVVEDNNVFSAVKLLDSICMTEKNTELIRAKSSIHNFDNCLARYLELYKSILN